MKKTLDPKVRAMMTKINQEMGTGTIVLGSDIHYESLPRIPSASLSLDVALGGGWPINSWNEVYGNESAGKSTVVLKTIAVNQQRDPNWLTLWVAAEEFVPSWAETLGVDLDRVIVHNDNGMEEAYGVIIKMLDERSVDCVVIDSLPALVPTVEDAGGMGDQQMGVGARINNKFFRKQGAVSKRSLTDPDDRPVTCFIINQFRDKIGVLWGDPRTTPGGKGKNFTYFTRVELSRDEWIMEGTGNDKRKVGITIKALIKKNKTNPPERVASFDFYFEDSADTGVKAGNYDPLKEILSLSRYFDVVKLGGGGMYSYGDQKWKGQKLLIDQLRYDLGLQKELTDEVMSCVVKGKRVDEVTTTPLAPKIPSPKTRSIKRVKRA